MRVGVDIGGTFTDVVLSDGAGRMRYAGKTPSTHAAAAVLEGIELALAETGASSQELELVVHATTLATNALLQGRGTPTALLTTEGFRDVLELARGRRPALYDLQFDRPQPLVPRRWRFEVRERMQPDGNPLVPLDEEGLRALVPQLRALAPTAVAVSFLHSYANPEHEARAAEIVREAIPGSLVIPSHEVLREVKEFERTSTTVICATLAPLLTDYLYEVETRLRERGIPGRFFVMHSGGGLMRVPDVATRAHTLVESGPAAGVLAATNLINTALDAEEAAGAHVAFDMGGTSAKACLIQHGRFAVTTDYEVGRGAHESSSVRLSGYPIKSPVIDLIESGQGGGSIAWVDAAGVLKVGPESAGAHPGPVCYGRGGELPTVTDCNLVLGRLDPGSFAGGSVTLHEELARRAIDRHLCGPLATSVETAAAAVLRVVNAAMARNIRVISVERGVDPRDLTLIAFGGAGPLHAAELGISRVLVPPEPGVFSAAGLVRSDLRMDFGQACEVRADHSGEQELRRIFGLLEREGEQWLLDAGGGGGLRRQADVRYQGQSHTLTVDVVEAPSLGDAIRQTFELEHVTRFGFGYPGSPVEVVVCRLTGSVHIESGSSTGAPAAVPGIGRGIASRPVYFPESGFVETAVLDRAGLPPGTEASGPAVIEERTSVVLVPPGSRCRVGTQGILRLDVGSVEPATRQAVPSLS